MRRGVPVASYLGIDIGGSSCKIVERSGSEMHMVAARMPENMISFGQITSPETMASFLRQVRAEHNVRSRNAVLVLSAAQSFFRHVTLPKMSVEEVKLNLPYEFRDFISGDADEYIYDYAVDPHERSGISADVGATDPDGLSLFAAAVSKDLVSTYVDILGKAGFKLKSVIPAPMAYTRLLDECVKADPAMADRNIVLVNIGLSEVVLTLFKGSHFEASKTIDFGCNQIDAAIAEVKGIDAYTASAYKHSNFEGVLDLPECQAVYDRIAIEVSKVVNFYNFSSQDKDVELMYFHGGGAQIPQLTETIANAIDVPAMPSAALLPKAAAGQDNAPVCTLAVGALLEGEAM